MIPHAGINPAPEALSAGCPMVALPINADQFGIAARLRPPGVAETIPAARVSAARCCACQQAR